MPFGLSSAPFIFTKILRNLVRFWREMGIYIVLYLDDGFCFADNYLIVYKRQILLKIHLLRARFVVNEEKSL